MKIVGLQKVSLIDFPERVAATVFLAGCNLGCSYCHNRWMIHEADVIEAMSVADFLSWLETRVGLLDGVCISGGEPTLQPNLPSLLRPIKAMGFAIKLDTNGTFPDRLAILLDEGLVDYVAMDVKAPLDGRYSEVAGRQVNLAAIRQSMELLRSRAMAYEFRTTVAPCLDEEALEDIAREIRGDEIWCLQPFMPAPTVDPSLAGIEFLDAKALSDFAQRVAARVPGVCVRGMN